MKLRHLPVDQIVVTKNVRTEADGELGGLMESISRFDVIQPVLVVPRGERFELVAGHRRLAAVKARGESHIPAVIREDLSENDIPLMKLAENVQRKEMSPVELVAAIEALKRAHPGISTSGLAKLLGKSHTWIADQYRQVQTMDELRAAGMSEDEIRKIPRSQLSQIHHVQEKEGRVQLGRDLAAGKVKGSGARSTVERKPTRGAYQDRSGGFSLLTGDGNTIRVVCTSARVRDEAVAYLLGLKSRMARKAALEHVSKKTHRR